MNTQFYKFKGIQSIAEKYPNDSTRELFVPGPVVGSKNNVANYDNLSKMTWSRRFQNGGTNQVTIPFGPERKNDFNKFINMNMSDWLVGGQAVQGFPGMLSNWGRFSIWNEKGSHWGLWGLGPNDKIGDILEIGDNFSVIVKQLTEAPTADHITSAKIAGVMDDNNCVHGVFNKAVVNSPFIQKHVNPKNAVCFSYYPPKRNGYDAYSNWHSFMRVKPEGTKMVISKRGTGRNYIIPITPSPARISNGQVKVLEAGVPYTLTDNTIELFEDTYELILHIHEINTQ